MTDSKSAFSLLPSFMKKCRVCGDKASAFNFDGLSCESCKSFFRRNASRESELECHKFDACEMTVKTRKFCPKCRLTRCLEIGMKKKFIYKRKHCQVPVSGDELPVGHSLPLNPEELNHYTNNGFDNMNSVNYPNLSNPSMNIPVPEPVPSSSAGPRNDSNYPSLTKYEKMKLAEVVEFYKAFKEENTLETILDPDRQESMTFCEEYAKQIVKVVKNIGPVKNYSLADKMLMVKNLMTIFIDMRYAFYYDVHNDFGYVQNFGLEETCFRSSMEDWKDLFTEDFAQEWKDLLKRNKFVMMNDSIIRDLLITIGLFREHPMISQPEMLRMQYLEYYYLLRRYLQVKLKHRDRFEKHMRIFHTVLGEYPLMERHSREFYQTVNQNYNIYLMAEIFCQ